MLTESEIRALTVDIPNDIRKLQSEPPVRVQPVVSVPRGYKRVAAQMDAIAREFKDGASMKRLSRKHSLPLLTIEFVIRMKMLGHSNEKLTDRRANNP